MPDTRAAVRRFLRGHRAAEERQRELVQREGPGPEQAVAEFFSLLNLLGETGVWPGRRDAVAERDIEAVRKLWVRVKKRALRGRGR